MLPQVSPAPAFTVSPNVPAKQLYWQGYDMFIEAYFARDPLTEGELASMTQEERRGFEAAGRHQADTETYAYLGNRNAYGDLTEY
jgi:hypothetical protein